jgi:hypothetical protein
MIRVSTEERGEGNEMTLILQRNVGQSRPGDSYARDPRLHTVLLGEPLPSLAIERSANLLEPATPSASFVSNAEGEADQGGFCRLTDRAGAVVQTAFHGRVIFVRRCRS